jgi:hypothetical protein
MVWPICSITSDGSSPSATRIDANVRRSECGVVPPRRAPSGLTVIEGRLRRSSFWLAASTALASIRRTLLGLSFAPVPVPNTYSVARRRRAPARCSVSASASEGSRSTVRSSASVLARAIVSVPAARFTCDQVSDNASSIRDIPRPFPSTPRRPCVRPRTQAVFQRQTEGTKTVASSMTTLTAREPAPTPAFSILRAAVARACYGWRAIALAGSLALIGAACCVAPASSGAWSSPQMLGSPGERGPCETAAAVTPAGNAFFAWMSGHRVRTQVGTSAGGLGASTTAFTGPRIDCSMSLSAGDGGDAFLTWSQRSRPDSTGARTDAILARRVGAQGQLGPLLRVAGSKSVDADTLCHDVLPTGESVVAWVATRKGKDRRKVEFRIIDAAGRLGPVRTLAHLGVAWADGPCGYNGAGGILFSWVTHKGRADLVQVRAVNGATLSPLRTIERDKSLNSGVSVPQLGDVDLVFSDADDRALIAWSERTYGLAGPIKARWIDRSGKPVEGIRWLTSSSGSCCTFDAEANPLGGVSFLWEDKGDVKLRELRLGAGRGRAQPIGSCRRPIPGEEGVTVGCVYAVAMDVAPDGSSVIAWTQGNGRRNEMRAVTRDAEGELSKEARVAPKSSDNIHPWFLFVDDSGRAMITLRSGGRPAFLIGP